MSYSISNTDHVDQRLAISDVKKNRITASPSGKELFLILLPANSAFLALALHLALPMNPRFIEQAMPYYTIFISVSLGIILLLSCICFINVHIKKTMIHKSYFIASLYLIFNVYNLVTLKFNLIPSIFFAYPDKILAVYYKDWFFLMQCLGNSFLLLASGVAIGASAGLFTGICVGWSPRAHYWIQPLIKCIGPIPSTAWIPIALLVYPTTFSASVSLIALAVWFPMTVLTSSGIQNVSKGYFEVASTLGASTKRQILRIAIPGAMPNMFIGFFNGICTAFLTLMSAEMIGVKSGIGWYINWKREVMEYANVYAGLILIAIFCSVILTLLFKTRARVLQWQQGTIRW